jgi:hypothetical protein
MALNKSLTQRTSHEQSPPETPMGNRPGEGVRKDLSEPKPEDSEAVSPEVSFVVADEVLRQRIRAFIEEKPKPSIIQRVLNHSLFAILVSFILAVPLGGFLTYLYTRRQEEESSRRSFTDELNKTRVQKIGEVWEQLDKNEVIIDDLLRKYNETPGSKQEYFNKIESLIDENRVIVNKNRFWLGKLCHDELNKYFSATRPIVTNMLAGPPGIDLSELHTKREQTKQDIERIRNMFLTGNLELCR